MPLKSVLLFAITVFGFGAAFSLTNIAVATIPPLWVAAGRSVTALLVLGAFISVRGRPVAINRAHFPSYIGIGLFTGTFPYILISWGQQHITSSVGSVLFASTPLLTLLLGIALFNAPRPSAHTFIGAIIGLSGVALAFIGPASLSTFGLLGAIATVFAAASYAAGGLLVQRIQANDVAGLTTIQLVPASVILVLVAAAYDGVSIHSNDWNAWAALIALGVIGTALPLVSLFQLVACEGAKTASRTTFLIPFVALAVGTFILDEVFSWLSFAGLVIALIGIAWSSFGQQKPDR